MHPPAIPALPLTLLTGLWLAAAGAAIKGAKSMREDWREVDALIAKADSVELGKLSPRILRLAEWLLKEQGDAVAQRYFEKGLGGEFLGAAAAVDARRIARAPGKAGGAAREGRDGPAHRRRG